MKIPKLISIARSVLVFFGSQLVLAAVLKVTNQWDWNILLIGGLAFLALDLYFQNSHQVTVPSSSTFQDSSTSVENVAPIQVIAPTFSLGNQRIQGREYFAGIPVSISESIKNLTAAQSENLLKPYYNKWTHITSVVYDTIETSGTTTIFFVDAGRIHAISFDPAWKDKVLLLAKGDAFEAEGCLARTDGKSVSFGQAELKSWNGEEIVPPKKQSKKRTRLSG
jgi:hypothetical protein